MYDGLKTKKIKYFYDVKDHKTSWTFDKEKASLQKSSIDSKVSHNCGQYSEL